MNEAQARRALVEYSRRSHVAGWVANHDGNLSVRINEDRIVCTPTSFSKIEVGLDDLVVVDGTGKKLAGRQRPFSELVLHLEVYRRRPNVNAVFHAHPPHATAFGVSGGDMGHPFLPEAVVSLGASIPTVPLTAPGRPGAEALSPFVRRCDAVLIAGNGVLSWGPDLETAYLRAELVEHLATIAHRALPMGGVKPLDGELVSALVAKRRKGGLSAPEEGLKHMNSGGETVAQALDKVTRSFPNVSSEVVARLVDEVQKELVSGN